MSRITFNGDKVVVGWHDTDLDVQLHRIAPRAPAAEPSRLAPGVIEAYRRPARPLWPVAVALVGAIAGAVVLLSGSVA